MVNLYLEELIFTLSVGAGVIFVAGLAIGFGMGYYFG